MKIIYTRKNEEIFVSDCDYELLNLHTWYLDSKGYARTQIGGNVIRMHHLVCTKNATSDVIDHINRIKHDNQRENLRSVDLRANSWNAKRDAGRSEYMGVKWNSAHDKFIAGLSVKNKRFVVATGYDVFDLAELRDYTTWRFRGRYAVLNFPEKDYSQFTHEKKERLDKRIDEWIEKYEIDVLF